MGIYSLRDVLPGEELTYDYQFQHFGLAAAAGAYRCKCGAPNCRGTMDTQPERTRVGGRARLAVPRAAVGRPVTALRMLPAAGTQPRARSNRVRKLPGSRLPTTATLRPGCGAGLWKAH